MLHLTELSGHESGGTNSTQHLRWVVGWGIASTGEHLLTRLHLPIRHLAKCEGLKCSIAVDSSPATTQHCCLLCVSPGSQASANPQAVAATLGELLFGSRAFRQAVRGGCSPPSVAGVSVAPEIFAAACPVALHNQNCHVAELMRLMQHSCCAGDKALCTASTVRKGAWARCGSACVVALSRALLCVGVRVAKLSDRLFSPLWG